MPAVTPSNTSWARAGWLPYISPWLSPDGKLVVFTSSESGGNQVLDAGFSRAAGQMEHLARTGMGGVDRTPAVVVQAPEVVATIDADGPQNWDVHPDGRRFIVAVPATESPASSGAAPQSRYIIQQNWFGELRRLTAAKPR